MKHLIIGYGSIGKRHYENLRSLTDDEIVTVDPDPNSGAHFHEWNSMLMGWVVYICTPTAFHYEYIDRAISQIAKAVFVEKPLISAGRFLEFETNITIVCGYQYRFHPVFQSIKRSGSRLSYLYMCASEDLSARYGMTALETMACHSIDAALWCAGPALNWKTDNRGRDAAITIRHKGGCISQIYANISLDPRISELRFVMDNRTGEFGIERHDPMYIDEMKAWLNFLNTGDYGDLCTYEQALRVQEIMKETR